jgi:DNA-binding NarL/FixJ family response regulator
MKKKSMIGVGLAGVLLSVVAVPLFASAHGMFGMGATNLTPVEQATRATEQFTREAQILGITVDEVKSYWAQGKGLREIATEKGISEETIKTKIAELRKTEMKDHLATLVSQGVITQAQADSRLAAVEKLQASGKGMMGRGLHAKMGL